MESAQDERSRKRSKKPRERRAKKPNKGFQSFVIDEADVSEGGDDEEFDDAFDEFADEAGEASQVEREMEMAQRRRWMQSAEMDRSQHKATGGASYLESAIGSLERRYQGQVFKDGDYDAFDTADGDYMGGDEINYDGTEFDPARLLPDVCDAKLWLIRCAKAGHERDICCNIMRKFDKFSREGKELPLSSVFACDAAKGYIYVESESPHKIHEALSGVAGIAFGPNSAPKMVPIKEMPDVFQMGQRGRPNVRRGEWIRMKHSIYANDLGQICDVDEQTGKATVRLVPRLDLPDLLERDRPGGGRGFPRHDNKHQRPMPKLFDGELVQSKGGVVEPGQDGCVKFHKLVFDELGYLLKPTALKHLIVGPQVSPTDQEIKEFRANTAAADDDFGKSCLPSTTRDRFAVGDKIQIVKGDLSGVVGKVQIVKPDTLTVLSEEAGIVEPFDVSMDQVVKQFDHGDSVRVCGGGMFSGDSGLITQVDKSKGTATFFSTMRKIEVTVNSRHLMAAGHDEVVNGPAAQSGTSYTCGDIVAWSGEAAIVCRSVGDYVSILTVENKVVEVPVASLGGKKTPTGIGGPGGLKDSVVLTSDHLQGQRARIVHSTGSHHFVKLHNPTQQRDRNGFAVVDAKCVANGAGGRGQPGRGGGRGGGMMMSGAYGGGMGNPFGGSAFGGGPFDRGSSMSGGGGGMGGGPGGRGRGMMRDPFINKTVQINAGSYKGSRGTVQSVFGDVLLIIPDKCGAPAIKLPKHHATLDGGDSGGGGGHGGGGYRHHSGGGGGGQMRGGRGHYGGGRGGAGGPSVAAMEAAKQIAGKSLGDLFAKRD